jgi:hypothetical protein
MISGSLHACVRGEKFQSTTRPCNTATPRQRTVASGRSWRALPPRSQVEWHMAFLLNMNGMMNRAVDVDGDTPFPWVLRDVLGMTGTKFGCGGSRSRRARERHDGCRDPSPPGTVDADSPSAVLDGHSQNAPRSFYRPALIAAILSMPPLLCSGSPRRPPGSQPVAIES